MSVEPYLQENECVDWACSQIQRTAEDNCQRSCDGKECNRQTKTVVHHPGQEGYWLPTLKRLAQNSGLLRAACT